MKSQFPMSGNTPKSRNDLAISVIYSELNSQRFAENIFPAPNINGLNKIRTIDIDTEVNGEKVSGTITIEPARGTTCYTTLTHDVILGLTRLWKDAGQPKEKLHASFGQLWRAMGNYIHHPSQANIKYMKTELDKLKKNFITFDTCFVTQEGIKDTSYEPTNILSELKIRVVENIKTKKIINRGFEFRFAPYYEANLDNNKTVIPANIDGRKYIKNTSAKVIQPMVERFLGKKIRHNQKMKSKRPIQFSVKCETLIIKRFAGYKWINYKTPSKQKRFLDRLAKAFTGMPLTIEGYQVNSFVSESAQPGAYKITFAAVHVNETDSNQFSNNQISKDIVDLLISKVGNKKNHGLYYTYAKHYSYTFIQHVIGIWEEDIKNPSKEIQNKHAWFTELVHIEAHKNSGIKYIVGCKDGKDCKYYIANKNG